MSVEMPVTRFWLGSLSRHIKARLVVVGDLELLTPAHFGNGDSADGTDMPLLTDALDTEKPLLTGASLAGALRAYLRRYSNNDTSLDAALFGGAQQAEDALQSPLITDDALGMKARIELRDGVKLEPKTRTAADKALFNIETWAAGTVFPLRLELALYDKAAEEQVLRALAAALTGLSNGSITLGARKNRGYGQVQVSRWKVRRYNIRENKDDLLAWLRNGNQPLPDIGVKIIDAVDSKGAPIGDADLMKALLAAFGSEASPVADRRDIFTIRALLSLESSLMIRGSTGEDDLGPDMLHLHLFRKGKMQPILSGTSLAGALRGRAMKIASTISSAEKADELVGSLFGPEIKGKTAARGSRIIVSDSIIQNAETSLVQNRIRIDRFTGGVVDGALFNEQPAFGKAGATRIEITLKVLKPEAADIGLLLLLLKDLWTGDLPLGGEIAIGRGRLRGIRADIEHKSPDKPLLHWTIEQKADNTLDISGDRTALENYVSDGLLKALPAVEVKNGA